MADGSQLKAGHRLILSAGSGYDMQGEEKGKGEEKANRYRAQLKIPQTHENRDHKKF
jgi:hypothetical protein